MDLGKRSKVLSRFLTISLLSLCFTPCLIFAAAHRIAWNPASIKQTIGVSERGSLWTERVAMTLMVMSFLMNGVLFPCLKTATASCQTLPLPHHESLRTKLNDLGQIIQSRVGGLSPFNYSYDAQGRLSSFGTGEGPEERTTNLTYNSQGYVDSITDALGRVTRFEYDGAGRIIRRVSPDLTEILFTYDANGNVTSITPPGKSPHLFTYTDMDLQKEYTVPDIGGTSRTTQYFYTYDQQLTEIVRPDGKNLSFNYDAAGRLSSLTPPNGQISFEYHPSTGNLQTISNSSGVTLSFHYDANLLTGQDLSGPLSGSVGLTHDNNFRVISQNVNGALPVDFSYDNDGFVVTAGGLSITRSKQDGLITGTQIGDISDTRTYNTFGELQSYFASYSGSDLFSVQYLRDKLGRIIQKTETVDGDTSIYNYAYDAVGNLVEVRKEGSIASQYTYDSNGNRLSFSDGVNTISGTYDAQDRLVQDDNTVYTYTDNGELLSREISGQRTAYQYDVLGNTLSITLPDNTLIEYIVDGANRRIGKKKNGILIQGLLYKDSLNPIAELDGTGAVVARFVYGTRTNVPDDMIRDGNTYRIITDHLGSPQIVINTETGEIRQRMDYDEFGRILLDTNPGFQPFGFAGGLYDPDTGLTRFGARDYMRA